VVREERERGCSVRPVTIESYRVPVGKLIFIVGLG